jgi:hypothetical protein
MLALGIALVGCTPAKPASCPLRPDTRPDLIEALAQLDATIERLDKLQSAADLVMDGLLMDELKFRDARAQAVHLRDLVRDPR